MPSELAVQESTLYRLTDDISAYFESREIVAAQLAEPLEPADVEPLKVQLAEIDGHLQRLGAELAEKTDNIAGVLRRMATEQDALKDEQERIYARRKTFERAEEWLRKYVVSVMQQRGLKQLKTPSNTLFIRQSDAAVISDPALIEDAYKNVTVKMPAWLWRAIVGVVTSFAPGPVVEGINAVRAAEDISLSAIKKAIKSGVTVDGADIEFHDGLVVR